MFVLKIKADAADIDVPAVRSMISFALLIMIVYRNDNNAALNIAAGIILFITDLFAKKLIVQYKINSLLLIAATAVLFAVATHDLLFPLMFMMLSFALKYSYTVPTVLLTDENIKVKKSYSTKTYEWNSFNNIILKDNLLSLDFKSNKLLQLELDDSVKTNEQQVNDFCAQKIIL